MLRDATDEFDVNPQQLKSVFRGFFGLADFFDQRGFFNGFYRAFKNDMPESARAQPESLTPAEGQNTGLGR